MSSLVLVAFAAITVYRRMQDSKNQRFHDLCTAINELRQVVGDQTERLNLQDRLHFRVNQRADKLDDAIQALQQQVGSLVDSTVVLQERVVELGDDFDSIERLLRTLRRDFSFRSLQPSTPDVIIIYVIPGDLLDEGRTATEAAGNTDGSSNTEGSK
jgi:hypothetical protein